MIHEFAKSKRNVEFTREEFSDNAKDLAALFVSAFDLENLQFVE